MEILKDSIWTCLKSSGTLLLRFLKQSTLGFLWWSIMLAGVLGIVTVALMLVFTYPILVLFTFIWFIAQRSLYNDD